MTANSPGPLSAVFFDCDGVLVDTEPLHYRAFQEILIPLGLGHGYEHYMECFIGFDDRDAFLHAFREAGRELDSAGLEALIEKKTRVLQELIFRGTPTFPGVVELVRELHSRNLPMAVASGALRHEVAGFLDSLGISGCFRAVVAAEDVRKSKPDPESYLLALDRLKAATQSNTLNPAGCIAIEDTPAGIKSAREAGLFVVAVTNSFAEAELRLADHVVSSLVHLDYNAMCRLIKDRQ